MEVRLVALGERSACKVLFEAVSITFRLVHEANVLHGRPLDEVAKATPIKFLVIVAAEDRMVTPQPALEWAKAKGAETYISPGSCAHLIMNCDAKAVSERVEKFLVQ